jgi:hypothetical protein
LLSCWLERWQRAHSSGASAAIRIASLVLDYAEDERRKLQAGSLRSTTELEGPHNTTEVLSANTVYHIGSRKAILIAYELMRAYEAYEPIAYVRGFRFWQERVKRTR